MLPCRTVKTVQTDIKGNIPPVVFNMQAESVRQAAIYCIVHMTSSVCLYHPHTPVRTMNDIRPVGRHFHIFFLCVPFLDKSSGSEAGTYSQ